MLKSFDRYVLKEIASPFTLGLVVYTFTLLINMIFILSGTLIAKEASTLTVLEILLYMLPDFLSFTIPMSTLMGVLAGLSRMSTDSEVVAFRTMGISNARILKPIMLFAVTAWLFSSWLIMYMAPEAGFRLNKLMIQIGMKRAVSAIKPGDFYREFPYYTLYFNDIDPNTNEWEEVFLYSRREGERDTVILAKSGQFLQKLHEKDSFIILKDAVVHSFDKKEPDKSYELTSYNSLREKVPNPVEMKQTRKSRQLIFPELLQRMKTEPKDISLDIEFQRKFALPFACLALGFLALSLGISTKKGGKISGFIVSLAVIFIYYTTSVTTENMIRKGILSPFLGMWGANIFLLVLGILLYYYTSKEKTLRWERLFDLVELIKNRIHRRQRQRHPSTRRKVILVIKIQRIRFGFRFFKIIDVYVARRLLLTFFLIFMSLILVFYVINIVELIDDVVENNVAFSLIFKYLYYHTPEIISFVLPVSVLTAVLLAFSVMSKNNELVAVQVSGISLYRLTLPAVVTGILLSLVFFYIQEQITPDANRMKREVLNQIHKRENKTDKEITKNWVMGENNGIYFYNYLDKRNKKIINFNVIYMDDQFSMVKRLSAQSARWLSGTELVLERGFERNFRGDRPVGFNTFKFKKMKIREGMELFTEKVAFPQFMNIKTLKRYINYLEEKRSNTQKYRAQLYYKYAYPLSSLIMVLIAVPFSFLMGNRGTFFGIGIAIVVSMVFWFCFAVFSALGSAALLSPFISAFGPIFIFTALSVYLFMNIKT
jgi:LPS export ABC transporter permease LptF/LPS export ABC transporter permease LptG